MSYPSESEANANTNSSYIEEGKKSGATVETGGNRHGDKGYFIEPTIFSNVTEDMKIQQEEIFGPVCTISKFKTKADVIKIGNNTTYGLAAAVHTSNLTTAIEVANALRAGTVWVNSYNTLHWQLPFGKFWLYEMHMRHILTSPQVVTRRVVLAASWVRRRWTTTFRLRLFPFVLVMCCSVK